MLSKIKNQQGVSLLVLIVMIVLVGIIALSITAFLIQNIALSLIEKDRARALYLAEAGLSDSFWELKNKGKLYGPPTQPLGQIDQQTISFSDGTSGTYQVSEPVDSIVSIGTYNGIVRKVKVGINSSPKDYVLFSGKVGDFDLANRCLVEGNVFVNGNVVVELPTNIDTTKMKLYLPKGNIAKYEDDSDFPYISLESPPSLPSLDIYYYDSLLAIAEMQLNGDIDWQGTQNLSSGVIYINGNLNIQATATISAISGPCTVVVSGRITMQGKGNKNISIGDSIEFISGEEILLQTTNITIGSSTGQSGNLLYSNKEIVIYDRNVINGSIISSQTISIGERAVVNGFTYAQDLCQVGQRADINGSIWAGNFLNGTTGSRINFIWRGDYIPSPLPRGIAEMESNFQLVANSWREIR